LKVPEASKKSLESTGRIGHLTGKCQKPLQSGRNLWNVTWKG